MLSTADQRRNEFFEWLATRVSSSQLSDLYDAFEEIDTFCQDRGILSPNLFLFTKASQVRQLRANLEAHRLYRYVGRLKTKRILSGLSHFETFLNTPQKVSEIQHKSPIQGSSNTSLNANNNDQSVEKVHTKVNPTYPQMGYPVTYILPDSTGKVTPEMLIQCLSNRPKLVSIMMANNELGTIEPVEELADIRAKKGNQCFKRKEAFHVICFSA